MTPLPFSVWPLLPAVFLAAGQGTRSPTAQAGEREYAGCGVSFRHPSDWVVSVDTTVRNGSCSYRLRPRAVRAEVDTAPIVTVLVAVRDRGVWAEAEEAGFERRSSGWVVIGRQGIESPADSLSANGWAGVRGTRVLGCYVGPGGTYSGTCEYRVALVGTRERSVYVEGGPHVDDVADRVVATLRMQP